MQVPLKSDLPWSKFTPKSGTINFVMIVSKGGSHLAERNGLKPRFWSFHRCTQDQISENPQIHGNDNLYVRRFPWKPKSYLICLSGAGTKTVLVLTTHRPNDVSIIGLMRSVDRNLEGAFFGANTCKSTARHRQKDARQSEFHFHKFSIQFSR